MAARGALILLALLSACGRREPRVAPGATVRMRYSLEADGKPAHETPGVITVTMGTGDLLPAVEARLMGRRAGEVVTLALTPAEGFGPRDEAKVQRVPLARFGRMADGLKVGDTVGGAAGGKAAEGVVTALDKDAVTLDFNPPLAGKTLTVRATLVEVRP